MVNKINANLVQQGYLLEKQGGFPNDVWKAYAYPAKFGKVLGKVKGGMKKIMPNFMSSSKKSMEGFAEAITNKNLSIKDIGKKYLDASKSTEKAIENTMKNIKSGEELSMGKLLASLGLWGTTAAAIPAIPLGYDYLTQNKKTGLDELLAANESSYIEPITPGLSDSFFDGEHGFWS